MNKTTGLDLRYKRFLVCRTSARRYFEFIVILSTQTIFLKRKEQKIMQYIQYSDSLLIVISRVGNQYIRI